MPSLHLAPWQKKIGCGTRGKRDANGMWTRISSDTWQIERPYIRYTISRVDQLEGIHPDLPQTIAVQQVNSDPGRTASACGPGRRPALPRAAAGISTPTSHRKPWNPPRWLGRSQDVRLGTFSGRFFLQQNDQKGGRCQTCNKLGDFHTFFRRPGVSSESDGCILICVYPVLGVRWV